MGVASQKFPHDPPLQIAGYRPELFIQKLELQPSSYKRKLMEALIKSSTLQLNSINSLIKTLLASSASNAFQVFEITR